jgi:hypothetical protein
LSVNQISPGAVVPALDNAIANLELLPQRVNSAKKDKLRALAKPLRRADLPAVSARFPFAIG